MRVTRTMALCMLLSTCVPTAPVAAQRGTQQNPDLTSEQGLGYAASGRAAVSASLTAAGTVGPFVPLAGRAFHAYISGTGSGTCALQERTDGTNWFPFQTVQGTPLVTVSYAGSPVNEVAVEPQAGMSVQWSCTSVSGTIAPGIGQ